MIPVGLYVQCSLRLYRDVTPQGIDWKAEADSYIIVVTNALNIKIRRVSFYGLFNADFNIDTTYVVRQ
jgi:hypothetical protein